MTHHRRRPVDADPDTELPSPALIAAYALVLTMTVILCLVYGG